ncbi:MAG TPA: leucyl aminopeptidase [Streptosporangiaceae bacterium]|nr:leucyl aminopeptidase [Streptosporangiaceae bacterium]
MPVTSAVTALARADLGGVGDFLAAVTAGSCEPADLVVVAVEAGGAVVADDALDTMLGMAAGEFAAVGQLTGRAGQSSLVVAKLAGRMVRVLLLGVGDRSARALRRAGGELGRTVRPGQTAVSAAVLGQDADQARAFAEGILLGSYRYSEKSDTSQQSGELAEVRLLIAAGNGSPDPAVRAIEQAAIFAAAVGLARDLTNTPSVRKSPQWLADACADVAARAGLAVRLWTEGELADAGFGGILAVGSGSARPPRLIELRYDPPGAERHVVLVGKGITFDSGGLSLKPNDGMKAMKTDMAGGAVVVAAMSALASLGVGDRITGLVAAAENMPSGAALRPGDVITQFGGRTVEVLNTDAEGRLVLADALAYAVANLAPDQIVDVATLTGAARIALGGGLAALYSTSDELAAALLRSGELSGDRLWRMPLTEDYRDVLDSPVAELANVARQDIGAGSVAAALFLREFAGPGPWAHLDIAGAARCGADDGELTAGATGFGTRLLLQWLRGASRTGS